MADLFDPRPDERRPSARAEAPRPLADRLRPRASRRGRRAGRTCSAGRPARRGCSPSGTLGSIILWGPPGCRQDHASPGCWPTRPTSPSCRSAPSSPASPTSRRSSRPRVCAARNGRGTLLFVDEIHRFNRAQQDAFLPLMEDGTIVLVGATTENPSFELNAALLSRAQVLVLNRLDEAALDLHRRRGRGRARPPPAADPRGARATPGRHGRRRRARAAQPRRAGRRPTAAPPSTPRRSPSA